MTSLILIIVIKIEIDNSNLAALDFGGEKLRRISSSKVELNNDDDRNAENRSVAKRNEYGYVATAIAICRLARSYMCLENCGSSLSTFFIIS
uniref:Protein kinase domain-containing protein n=1 Tax=Loa loa TaxID=7209 RepID=A0A1I7V953_LOALO